MLVWYVTLTCDAVICAPASTTSLRLVLLCKVQIARDLPEDEQMADKKELTVKRALCPDGICRTQQRGVAQTDCLMGEVIKDHWLYVFCTCSWSGPMHIKGS